MYVTELPVRNGYAELQFNVPLDTLGDFMFR